MSTHQEGRRGGVRGEADVMMMGSLIDGEGDR
jgi:hypothetical protein